MQLNTNVNATVGLILNLCCSTYHLKMYNRVPERKHRLVHSTDTDNTTLLA